MIKVFFPSTKYDFFNKILLLKNKLDCSNQCYKTYKGNQYPNTASIKAFM